DVGLGRQRLDGRAELGARLLDLAPQRRHVGRCVVTVGRRNHRTGLPRLDRGHRCLPSLTAPLMVSMSALTLRTASVGVGGAAFLNWPRPRSTIRPATRKSTTPMMSAESQAGTTVARPRTAAAIRTPTP